MFASWAAKRANTSFDAETHRARSSSREASSWESRLKLWMTRARLRRRSASFFVMSRPSRAVGSKRRNVAERALPLFLSPCPAPASRTRR